MSYLVLSILLLVILVLVFLAFGKELLCPAVIVPLIMLGATALAAIGMLYWNRWELSTLCVALITAAVMSFCLGSAIAKRFLGKVRSWETPFDHFTIELAGGYWKYAILAGIVILAFAVHVVESMQIAAEAGVTTSSALDAIAWARQHTDPVFSTETVSFESGYSLIDRGLQKASTAIGYVCVAASLFHFSAKNWKRFAIDALLVAATALASFAGGGRMAAFCLVAAVLLGSFILSLRQCRREHSDRVSLRYAVVLAAIAAVGGLAFFFSGALVGRSSNSPILDYLSFYFGCGIPGFERILTEGLPAANGGLYATFSAQIDLLYKLGIVSEIPQSGSYWMNMSGYMCNVYTFLYPYYACFGIAGCIVFPMLSGLVYTLLYERMFRKRLHPASLAAFLLVGVQLFDIERSAKLFSTLFTANTLLVVLIILVVSVWLFLPKTSHGKNPD